ncbi:MAG: flagellar basal body protein FliL [Treponema sp.]|nr:flagellar basal body protein FliL [Treponema sp.]
MKREIGPARQARPKAILIVYRIAIALVLALVAVISVGSVFALARPPDAQPLFQLGRESAPAVVEEVRGDWALDGHFSVFTGIGRLRIPLSGQSPAALVLSVSFPYASGDAAFSQEISTRAGEFQAITTEYFSRLSRQQIAVMNEDLAKSEILALYNALLRLGRIEDLFFTDLILLD